MPDVKRIFLGRPMFRHKAIAKPSLLHQMLALALAAALAAEPVMADFRFDSQALALPAAMSGESGSVTAKMDRELTGGAQKPTGSPLTAERLRDILRDHLGASISATNAYHWIKDLHPGPQARTQLFQAAFPHFNDEMGKVNSAVLRGALPGFGGVTHDEYRLIKIESHRPFYRSIDTSRRFHGRDRTRRLFYSRESRGIIS